MSNVGVSVPNRHNPWHARPHGRLLCSFCAKGAPKLLLTEPRAGHAHPSSGEACGEHKRAHTQGGRKTCLKATPADIHIRRRM